MKRPETASPEEGTGRRDFLKLAAISAPVAVTTVTPEPPLKRLNRTWLPTRCRTRFIPVPTTTAPGSNWTL